MLTSGTVMKSGCGAFAAALVGAALSGCAGGESPTPKSTVKTAEATTRSEEKDAVAAERAKLSPEDRQLVEAQEWCAINSEDRLGEMGPPVKIMVKDQPVFLCCNGCKKAALADPDKTLAKVEELKAKAKAAKDAK